MLRNNLQVYGLNTHVQQIFGDCVEEIPKIKEKNRYYIFRSPIGW